MSTATARTAFDSRRFRDVMGVYPTGVSVVTAIGTDERPAGLAVGSFTSVSLDPPLVAFLPDKSSTSWPKIRDAGYFCVNVLASDQESLCRVFASKAEDKFAGVGWRPASSGAPVLDGVVAWIDCDLEAVHEAGDHYIVVGRVRDLDFGDPSLPLLFFRGGYGRFTPLTFVAVEADLLDQLRLVDAVRPAMGAVAADLDLECNAAVIVGDELVYTARAGKSPDEISTRVGRRLPFRPPVGIPFVAWGGESSCEKWLSRMSRRSASEDLDRCRRLVERVRRRGYSLGLGHEVHRALWDTIEQSSAEPSAADGDASIHRLMDELLAGYEQPDLLPGERYEIRTISAPVFGPDERVAFQFTLYGLAHSSTVEEIEACAARLLEATGAATTALGGRKPT